MLNLWVESNRKDNMTKKKKWEWDSIQINLTDPDKKIITLTSAEVSDFFMEQCFQEIQEYVEKKGGELA